MKRDDVAAVRFDLDRAQLHYYELRGEAKSIRRQIAEADAEMERLDGRIQLLIQAGALYKQVSEHMEESLIALVNGLVTDGLRAIFGQQWTFEIRPSMRNKTVQMDLMLSTAPGEEQQDLLNSHGGGAVAVVGVLLRVIMLRLMQDSVAQVLVLDEPFAMLSKEYVEPCGALLRQLADDLGVQILMVTHQPEFAEYADVSYTISRGPKGAEVARGS